MSKIGKKPIKIPEAVKLEIKDDEIRVKGPKGELIQKIHPDIRIEERNGYLIVLPKNKTPSVKKMWGLFRALCFNMIEGVTKGFEKKLILEGVGFRANIEGEYLVLNLGFTHPVKIKRPEGITFSVDKNIITVSGPDKQKVGEVAAIIRKQKEVEPYKGKGIRYEAERVRRKEGKKVVASK